MDSQIVQIDIQPVNKIDDAKGHYQVIVDFIKSVMKDGTDYGKLPGMSKPTLYKPGAEKLIQLFNLRPEFQQLEAVTDWSGKDHGLDEPIFHYRYKCVLHYPRFPKHGEVTRAVGEGIGSCNSLEKKYRYRQQNRKCPKCGKETIFTSKDDGSFYCWTKKDGCGAKYPANHTEILNQPTSLIKNPDIYEMVNTIDKMAQKRALIAGVLITCGVSEFFSQDMDTWEGIVAPTDADESPNKREIAIAQVGELIKDLKWTIQEAQNYLYKHYKVTGRKQLSIAQLYKLIEELKALKNKDDF